MHPTDGVFTEIDDDGRPGSLGRSPGRGTFAQRAVAMPDRLELRLDVKIAGAIARPAGA
jgi:hypothetical protein